MSGDDHDEDEDALWALAMTGVDPLHTDKKLEIKALPVQADIKPIKERKAQKADKFAKPTASKNSDLDLRTENRLKRGQISIDARLDLHGMNKEQARERLLSFIQQSYNRGARCLLVITGKGRGKNRAENWLGLEKGVLRENLPFWLSEPLIEPLILKHVPAKPKDGGDGAFYIYMRKNN